MIAALSLPARKFSSMTRLASADSEPRARKVSLSSAARVCNGPCSGTIASVSSSQAPMTAQRSIRLDAAADAFDLRDDALLGVHVDELRVQLDRDGLTGAVLHGHDELAALLAGLLLGVRQGQIQQL